MRKKNFIILLITLCLGGSFLFAGEFNAQMVKDFFPQELSGQVSIDKTLEEKDASLPLLISFQRNELTHNLSHYQIIIKVGQGEYDLLSIHRVVKEQKPFVPVSAKEAVLLIHGDSENFVLNFLTPPDLRPYEATPAGYMAENDIDVWGIDRRPTLVPLEENDFSFMKDWGTELYINDIEITLAFARKIRQITGSGKTPFILSGFSRGAQLTYAYANYETKKTENRRHVKGIIPMDMYYKFSDENNLARERAFYNYGIMKQMYDSGIYVRDEGILFYQLAALAYYSPDDVSPFFPPMTNRQVGLYLLTIPEKERNTTVDSPFLSIMGYTHNFAGIFNASGIPDGLRYADENEVNRIILSQPPYMSLKETLEGYAIASGQVELPFDDHLDKINLPVLYVGAGGGFGRESLDTLDLLGSRDKKHIMISFEPAENAPMDYGHSELLKSYFSIELVWTPVVQWIKTH